jgi:type IV pilus assembly protein PilA
VFCSKCGTTIAESSESFCPKCGASLQSEPQPAAPRPAAPAAAAAAVAARPAPAPTYLRVPGPNVPAARPYLGEPQTDGKAVGSLICGICSLIGLWLLAGIPAIVLGHLAKSSIRQSMGRLKGDGMATAGLVMGYLSVAALPVIMIIAAIAIPSLLRARMAANASGATATVRAVNAAQVTYALAYPDVGFAKTLQVLGPGQPPVACSTSSNASAEHACLIDSTLACGFIWCTKAAYRFNLTGICAADKPCGGYVITATPVTETTGINSYCSADDAVIRYHTGSPLAAPLTTAEECQLWPQLD